LSVKVTYIEGKGKSKVVPLHHTFKTYWGTR